MASIGAITAPHITQTAKSMAKLISQLRSELTAVYIYTGEIKLSKNHPSTRGQSEWLRNKPLQKQLGQLSASTPVWIVNQRAVPECVPLASDHW